MSEKELQELLAMWQQAQNELNKYAADFGLGWNTSEPRALTSETVKELDRLQQRVDELWKAYRKASPF